MLLAALVLFMGGCRTTSHESGGPLTVILVRHAERTDAFGDPQLTVAGRERAEALVSAVGEYGITAIYASQFARTRQTAEALANHLVLPVRVASVTSNVKEWADAFAAELRRQHVGETVLVVGHSNTVPLLAEALVGGAVTIAPMPESEYDRLLIVDMKADGSIRVIRARYGARPAGGGG